MRKTEYAHHVIQKYISITAVCTFAMENYKQQTAENANQVLREQFNKSMEAYETIYSGMQDWVPSIEQMVDYKTVSMLQVLAERNTDRFIEEFKALLSADIVSKFKFDERWKCALSENENEIADAIYHLIRELRKFEEQEM